MAMNYKYIGSISAELALDRCEDIMVDCFNVKDLILEGNGEYDKQAAERTPADYNEEGFETGDGYIVCEYEDLMGGTNFDLFQVIVTDRNGKEITNGSKAIWYDPDPAARDLSRVWEVYEVTEEIVHIADEYGEAEVLPSELEVVKSN